MMETPQRRHVLQWHITHLCNLRCVHCYQEEYARHMDKDMMGRVLEKYERYLKLLDLPGQINLTGGEPLLHPGFFDLARTIRSHGHRLAVLTNGTLIDRETASRLAALRPVFVQVSLDGTRAAHDSIRGERNFDRALLGIDRLKEKNVKVLVSFTAQKGNRGELADLARVCREHKVDKLWWDRVVTASPEETERLALSTEEFMSLVKTGNELRQQGFPVDNSRALQFCGDPGCGGYRCSAGGDLLIVLADGSLMPCRRLPFVVGHIDDGEIAQVLARDPEMRRLRLARVPAFCRSCRDLFRCFGGAKCVTYAQAGRWDRPDVNCPYLAEREESLGGMHEK